MTIHHCMDCGMLLPPGKAVCPVCGFDNHHHIRNNFHMDERSYRIFPDAPPPETIPGF